MQLLHQGGVEKIEAPLHRLTSTNNMAAAAAAAAAAVAAEAEPSTQLLLLDALLGTVCATRDARRDARRAVKKKRKNEDVCKGSGSGGGSGCGSGGGGGGGVVIQIPVSMTADERTLAKAMQVRIDAVAGMNTTVLAVQGKAGEITAALSKRHKGNPPAFRRQVLRITQNLQRSGELRALVHSGEMSAEQLAVAKATQLCPPVKEEGTQGTAFRGSAFCGLAASVRGFHD
jgi:hypothetical protein